MRLEVTDLRTITDDAPWVRNFEFRGGKVSIGAHSESLLQLPDVDVAAHHASIERVGDSWIYQPTTRDDRQTKINDQPANGRHELKNGDVIQITHFEIRVEIEAETAEVEVTQVGRLGELAMIKQYPIPPRSTTRKPDEKVSLSATRQRAIGDFALKLRHCADLPAVMETTLKLLESDLTTRMTWIGLRKTAEGPLDFVDGRLEGAVSMAEPPKLETYFYRCLTRHQHLNIPRTGDGVTQSVLAVPILSGQNAIGLLYADTKRRTRVFDDSDLEFITLVAAVIRPLLQTMLQSTQGLFSPAVPFPSRARKEAVNEVTAPSSSTRPCQGRLGAEVAATTDGEPVAPAIDGRGARGEGRGELADTPSGWALVHDFRDKIEPKKLPQWPTLELAHYGLKGKQRAGDILDVIKMPNGLAAVLLGHVTADASRTAMAISEIRGAFRVAGLHADPPRVQLRELNWLLSDKEHACAFDGVVAVINPKSGAFEISTAGRVGAFLIAPGAAARSFVSSDAPAVGNGQVIEYKGQTAKIGNGETLALFTAGAADAIDDEGKKLGAKRIVEALTDNSSAAPLEELTADLRTRLGSGAQADDATVVLIRRPAT